MTARSGEFPSPGDPSPRVDPSSPGAETARSVRSVWTSLFSLFAVSFLLLPILALLTHVDWKRVPQSWVQHGGALATSFGATAWAMTFIVLLGTPLGYRLARRQTRLWRTVELVLLIPLLLPPLVIGLLLVYLYGPYGLLGSLLAKVGLSGTNSLTAVVIAEIYEALPYYVFAAQAAFGQVQRGFERTSYTLGRSPFYTFLRITLPLSAPGLTAGLTMAFARAIGAFGAVIVVAYYPHTLPVSTWVALNEEGLPAAWPIALLLTVTALPLPLAAGLWRRMRDAASDH